MKRYVLTGTPGAGKTTLIEELRRLGYPTVGEAATAVIARGQAAGEPAPWESVGFVDRVLAVQQAREAGADADGVWFFDRSPVCTLALSRYLGRRPSRALTAEIERIRRAGTYERTVFFVANLGFVEPTAARRMTFEEAVVFEQLHREVYEELGYQLCDIAVATPGERVAAILEVVAAAAG